MTFKGFILFIAALFLLRVPVIAGRARAGSIVVMGTLSLWERRNGKPVACHQHPRRARRGRWHQSNSNILPRRPNCRQLLYATPPAEQLILRPVPRHVALAAGDVPQVLCRSCRQREPLSRWRNGAVVRPAHGLLQLRH